MATFNAIYTTKGRLYGYMQTSTVILLIDESGEIIGVVSGEETRLIPVLWERFKEKARERKRQERKATAAYLYKGMTAENVAQLLLRDSPEIRLAKADETFLEK